MKLFPTRWSGLLNEDSEIDGFLLTIVGRIGSDLRIEAVRGSYGTDADPGDLLLCLGRGPERALVSAQPLEQVFGFALAVDELVAAGQFIAEHRVALVDHWTGAIDSLDLLRCLSAADDIHDQAAGSGPARSLAGTG